MARHFPILAQRLYNRYNHAHESWPRAGLQVFQNSGSWTFKLRVKTLSVRDRH